MSFFVVAIQQSNNNWFSVNGLMDLKSLGDGGEHHVHYRKNRDGGGGVITNGGGERVLGY